MSIISLKNSKVKAHIEASKTIFVTIILYSTVLVSRLMVYVICAVYMLLGIILSKYDTFFSRLQEVITFWVDTFGILRSIFTMLVEVSIQIIPLITTNKVFIASWFTASPTLSSAHPIGTF